MKRSWSFMVAFTLPLFTNGQVLHVQGGPTFSTLDWRTSATSAESLYDGTLVGHAFYVGCSYLERKVIGLSTNIGIVRRGGKGEVILLDQGGNTTATPTVEKPTLNYVSLNTMLYFNLGKDQKALPFLAFGPRVDRLVQGSRHFDVLKEHGKLERVAYGLILSGGIKAHFENFQIGLGADYYVDVSPVAQWPIDQAGNTGKVTMRTFSIALQVGYPIN